MLCLFCFTAQTSTIGNAGHIIQRPEQHLYYGTDFQSEIYQSPFERYINDFRARAREEF